MAIMQVSKRTQEHEGRPRQAALSALTAFYELKHVILVDDDIDLYNMSDVMWAMTTRYQGDVSTVCIPAVRGHALDVSATPDFNPLLRGDGIGCKTIFDCTVPMHMKDQFERSPFIDVDLAKYFPGDEV